MQLAWKQPTSQIELLARLADARDLDVPERERENLCACAHVEIVRLNMQHLTVACAVSEREDKAEVEFIALRQRAVAAEAELERVKPHWEQQLHELRAENARLTTTLEMAQRQNERLQAKLVAVIERALAEGGTP